MHDRVAPSRFRHVVVVGGGLAGLAAAETLLAEGCGVTIVEPRPRTGGVLATVVRDGWLVERSADSFLAARPEAVELVGRLGLQGELVAIDPSVRRALVWHDGRTVPAPHGFRLLAPGRVGGIAGSRLLSAAGRLRVLAERLVPRRRHSDGDDESLESFARRRLGDEAFERLVQPLASGIWTADPSRLSMAAACGEFFAMEQEHGSLWAGERARLRRAARGSTASGARYGQFLSLTGGMARLPQRLAEQLQTDGARLVRGRATTVSRKAGGWTVNIEPAEEDGAAGAATELAADAVVVALPAPAAARILASLDRPLAADLSGIEYAGSAIISLGFDRRDVGHPLDAAGLVVPRRSGRRALAVSFSSSKFPGRAPEGCVLVRVFVGGALDPAVLEFDDQRLEALARAEVEVLIAARGRPRLVQIDRWGEAMPQYHVGHLEQVARIAAGVARHAGLALAGAAYTGVGIPQVIASGRTAARTALKRATPDPDQPLANLPPHLPAR